jgi:hypothetical protein
MVTIRQPASGSRFPFIRSLSGACQSAFPWSAVSQLPNLTPSFFTPLTRLIPAAKSALRRPHSDASYAKRRTAQMAGLEMHAIANDHSLAEGQPPEE